MAQPSPETRAARRKLRALRLALSPAERSAAEQAIADSLRRMGVFRRGRRVAVYLAMPGEVNLEPMIAAAWRAGCRLFVPRVTSRRRGAMRFVPLDPGTRFRANCYGIAEPESSLPGGAPPLTLDTILLPVVGFDRLGNRLGMGAGYYDRALRHRRDPGRRWRRPRLVGLAFACQQTDDIVPSRWDVPLDAVVTEREVILAGRAPSPWFRSNA
jgi:5-formyltetrahydrofolate cyclo-ligase